MEGKQPHGSNHSTSDLKHSSACKNEATCCCAAGLQRKHRMWLRIKHVGQLITRRWCCGKQGASSDVFIREAMRLMHERGYTLGNLDATIIAEARMQPKCQWLSSTSAELMFVGSSKIACICEAAVPLLVTAMYLANMCGWNWLLCRGRSCPR